MNFHVLGYIILFIVNRFKVGLTGPNKGYLVRMVAFGTYLYIIKELRA